MAARALEELPASAAIEVFERAQLEECNACLLS